MKKFKKILALLLSAFFSFVFAVNAVDNTYVYRENNVEIQIAHPNLSEEKLLIIVHTLTSEQSDVQPYGLMCTLFGHKLVTTETQVVRHLVYETYPHCEAKSYLTTICERENCNYTENELLATEPFGCCVP